MQSKIKLRLPRGAVLIIMLAVGTVLLSSCGNLVGWPTFIVAYDPNGGTGSMPNSRHWHGTHQELSVNTFSRPGFRFVGWALTRDGLPVFNNQQRVKNLSEEDGGVVTLYAVWLPGS